MTLCKPAVFYSHRTHTTSYSRTRTRPPYPFASSSTFHSWRLSLFPWRPASSSPVTSSSCPRPPPPHAHAELLPAPTAPAMADPPETGDRRSHPTPGVRRALGPSPAMSTHQVRPPLPSFTFLLCETELPNPNVSYLLFVPQICASVHLASPRPRPCTL
jgi:hypothetical protein